jgi:hypothetical protein
MEQERKDDVFVIRNKQTLNQSNLKCFTKINDLNEINKSLLQKLDQWCGKFIPEINISFCVDFERNEDDFIIPHRIKEGLKLGLGDILKSSYPLIISSSLFSHLVNRYFYFKFECFISRWTKCGNK